MASFCVLYVVRHAKSLDPHEPTHFPDDNPLAFYTPFAKIILLELHIMALMVTVDKDETNSKFEHFLYLVRARLA